MNIEKNCSTVEILNEISVAEPKISPSAPVSASALDSFISYLENTCFDLIKIVTIYTNFFSSHDFILDNFFKSMGTFS
jgi:hypothetical protein